MTGAALSCPTRTAARLCLKQRSVFWTMPVCRLTRYRTTPKPGDACRHNVHVWHGGAYAGIGPGAHGRVVVDGKVHATRRTKPPALWLKKVTAEGHGTQEDTVLTPGARAEEMVILGLRLETGLDLAHLEQATGLGRFKVMSEVALELIVSEGLITLSSDFLKTTKRGRLVLNRLISTLLC